MNAKSNIDAGRLWRCVVLTVVVVGSAGVARAQAISEFPIPSGNTPALIAAGPDGALWFAEAGQLGGMTTASAKIGRITISGVIAEFAVPTTNGGPVGIAMGPDGALWFTEFNGNKIGQITTQGTVTEFSVPTGNSGPGAIASGPDGALWFTENTSNKIGRISTGGTVTEFTIPTGSSAPALISAGPDGALWFTESSANRIGRITTSGTVTGFTVPTSGSGLTGITTGPDGALWFTEANGNKIGRIATTGTITEFPISATARQPAVITAGPDGALWFTETSGNKIGRITTTGAVGEFAVPTSGSMPLGIATGPDGALWFTEAATGKIGRLVPPASTNPLLAAVLPSSRSIQVAGTATAFATIINSGSAPASGCAIVPVTPVPASFVYQTTNPATNALTGSANTPATIPAGSSQSFVIGFTANAPEVPITTALGFDCSGLPAAVTNTGLNTLLYSASATPVPDIVALAATTQNDGILHITGSGSGAFAVATVNVGAGSQIIATANTGSASLPLALTLCQTNPQSGGCLASPSASVTTTINGNATPTFAIFGTASGAIAFDPAHSRVFVQFADANGAERGATSVAVQTQ